MGLRRPRAHGPPNEAHTHLCCLGASLSCRGRGRRRGTRGSRAPRVEGGEEGERAAHLEERREVPTKRLSWLRQLGEDE